MFRNSLTPVLSVNEGRQAIDFYRKAFGAEEVTRTTSQDGHVVAELRLGQARFRVAHEAPEHDNVSPTSLGGTTVRLNLFVADPDATVAAAVEAGAILVSPVEDQSYGLRQGRIADPFGHHWLIGRPLPGQSSDWAR
jgi:PhnB protein